MVGLFFLIISMYRLPGCVLAGDMQRTPTSRNDWIPVWAISSGVNNSFFPYGVPKQGSVPSVNVKSRKQLVGPGIISSGVLMAAAIRSTISFCYIQPVTCKSTAKSYLLSNRVRLRALERLERLEGKLSRAVLRGREVSNGLLLPDPFAPKRPFPNTQVLADFSSLPFDGTSLPGELMENVGADL